MGASPGERHHCAGRAEPGVLCRTVADGNGCSVWGSSVRIFTGRGIWDTPERARLPACSVPVEGSFSGRDPDGPVKDTYLDTTRIRHDTGYQPEYGLTGGLADITPPASGT